MVSQASLASLAGKCLYNIASRTPHGFQLIVVGSALGTPIGSALLVGGLRTEIPKMTTEISADAVINAGATGLSSLTKVPTLVRKLRDAYSIAISHVMILLVVVICISVPTALGMKWLNIKKVSIAREEEQKRSKVAGKEEVNVLGLENGGSSAG